MLGSLEGRPDGSELAISVGLNVSPVGNTEGISDGPGDGATVGTLEGLNVGMLLAVNEGRFDGMAVGVFVCNGSSSSNVRATGYRLGA